MNATIPATSQAPRQLSGRYASFSWAFHRLLDRIDAGLVSGSIEATLPDGRHRLLGGRAPGPAAIVAIPDWRALVRLVSGGSSGWYVAWADGD